MKSTREPGLRKRLGLRLFSELYREKIARHHISTIFWECTLRCNLQCRHCGSDCRAVSAVPDMPISDFLKAVDSVTPHVEPNRVMVVMTGGEALLRDDLETCGLELHRRGYPWGLVTNGMTLTEDRFLSLREAGMRSISISIDGFEDVHNYIRRNDRSFERAVAALDFVTKEPSIKSDVVTCVNSMNLTNLGTFRDFLYHHGVRSWRLFSIFPAGRAAESHDLQLNAAEFTRLLEFIRNCRREGHMDVSYACEGFLGRYETEVRDTFYHCAAGISVVGIKADGGISGCTSIRADFDQGNIYRDNLWQVWNERFVPFRDREWTRKGECADCEMFRYCLGGGMHLRDDDRKLTVCHYHKII